MIYPLPKLRVLCIDDNHDTADSAGLLLEIYGCEVAVCYDGETALTLAFQFEPDLCLIDLNMPGIGGHELARRLRAWAQGHSLHLIAVTAYNSDAARIATAAAGFDLHFVKPVDWGELMDVLVKIERSLGRGAFISSRLAQLAEEATQ